jgi:hypothetical protein
MYISLGAIRQLKKIDTVMNLKEDILSRLT